VKAVKEIAIKRSALPLVAMLSSLTLLMGAAAVVQRTAEAHSVKPATVNDPVLHELDDIAVLLEQGREVEAKRGLDAIGAQPLTISARANGEGALHAYAPTTLIMRTGRAMLKRAEMAAERGDRTTAMGWIERCRELSGQVLSSPKPGMDALNVARYLDKHAATAEIAVLKQLNETQAAEMAAERDNAIQGVWQNTIMARVKALVNRWGADGDDTTIRESHAREEQELASEMVRLYQSQRSGQRVVQHAPTNDKSA
jgi:hypothetical protein